MKTISFIEKLSFRPYLLCSKPVKPGKLRVANSHVDSVTPFRSMILSCQWSPYLINIQLRRLLHRESRGLQLSSATLYNKQRKQKDSMVKDRESRNEEFWNIHELESAIHLSRKEQYPFARNNRLFVDARSKEAINVAVCCLFSRREKLY